MTIFQKLSLLIWINGEWKALNSHNGGKMQNLLNKVDGLKSVLGLLAVVAYYASPAFGGPQLPDLVLKMGISVASVGLLAKMEKGMGMLSTVIGYAHTALDAMQKVVNAVAPKPPTQ